MLAGTAVSPEGSMGEAPLSRSSRWLLAGPRSSLARDISSLSLATPHGLWHSLSIGLLTAWQPASPGPRAPRKRFSKRGRPREFPGGPVLRTWCFHCWGLGSILGWGTKIPQASQCSQKKKKKKKGQPRQAVVILYLSLLLKGASRHFTIFSRLEVAH